MPSTPSNPDETVTGVLSYVRLAFQSVLAADSIPMRALRAQQQHHGHGICCCLLNQPPSALPATWLSSNVPHKPCVCLGNNLCCSDMLYGVLYRPAAWQTRAQHHCWKSRTWVTPCPSSWALWAPLWCCSSQVGLAADRFGGFGCCTCDTGACAPCLAAWQLGPSSTGPFLCFMVNWHVLAVEDPSRRADICLRCPALPLLAVIALNPCPASQ